MDEINDNTFIVYYVDGSEKISTIICILENHIICPMTPGIPCNALNAILINVSRKEKYRERSFGLVVKGKIYNFIARNQVERNNILYEILSRFPPNSTNRRHWKKIGSAADTQRLLLDRKSVGRVIREERESLNRVDRIIEATGCAMMDLEQRVRKLESQHPKMPSKIQKSSRWNSWKEIHADWMAQRQITSCMMAKCRRQYWS